MSETLPAAEIRVTVTSEAQQKPHSCPVCGGRGTVHAGFYRQWLNGTDTTADMLPVSCRSCGGTGIVWR